MPLVSVIAIDIVLGGPPCDDFISEGAFYPVAIERSIPGQN
jgi:site-specific DNA-cytosine methylase